MSGSSSTAQLALQPQRRVGISEKQASTSIEESQTPHHAFVFWNHLTTLHSFPTVFQPTPYLASANRSLYLLPSPLFSLHRRPRRTHVADEMEVFLNHSPVDFWYASQLLRVYPCLSSINASLSVPTITLLQYKEAGKHLVVLPTSHTLPGTE